MTAKTTGRPWAERRQITVLFSDLSASTQLASSVEAEEYAELLRELKNCFERVIPRHGGIITQVQGDGVLAMFGLEPREDEGRRAAEAALELHRAVKGIALAKRFQLSMHSGIHSGLVLVVEGDGLDGRYVLIGDAPNVAARLSDEAVADEILASEISLGTDRHFFETGAERRIPVKGLDEPVSAFPVLAHANVETRFAARRVRGLTPLVGRERELNLLRSEFEASLRCQLRVLFIVGMPGIGKTRLAEEFLLEMGGDSCVVLRGFCESYLTAEPLQPLLQMLRQALRLDESRAQPPALDDVADRLVEIDPMLISHASTLLAMLSSRENISRPSEETLMIAASTLLQKMTSKKPVVLFVDDWQWADDTTRRILTAVGRVPDQRLFMLISSRESTPIQSTTWTSMLELEPLAPAHGADIINSLLPHADPFLSDRLQRASGGNPLFLEELCHSAANTGNHARPYFHEPNDSRRIPNYLKMLIESRVSRLSAEQIHVVQAAAVIGNVVPIWLLEQVTGPANREEMLTSLSGFDLIFPGESTGTLRFKHGITREVILDSVGMHERRALHAATARAIEEHVQGSARDDFLEALAYHYGETTDFETAARYAEAAGDKAVEATTLDRARLHYQAALKALDGIESGDTYEQWISIAKRLAMASLYDAQRGHRQIFDRAVQLATERRDHAAIAEAEYQLAYVNYALGEGRDALLHSERAQTAAAHLHNTAFNVQITATRGQALAIAGRYEPALQALDDALTSQRPYRNKPRVSMAYAYSLAAKGMVLGDRGDFEVALECFNEADEVIGSSGHEIRVSAASMRCGVYLWQGRWDAALEYAERTVQIADRIGSYYMSAMGVALAGYARWHLVGSIGADELVRGMSWIESRAQMLWTSLHYGWLTEVMVDLGRYQEARSYAARALQRSRKLEHLGEATALCALARIPAGEFARRAPIADFQRASKSADLRQSRREHAMISYNLARFHAEQGEYAEARHLFDASCAEFSDMGMYWYAARAQALAQSEAIANSR